MGESGVVGHVHHLQSKQWKRCISLTNKGFFQEGSLYFTKSGRGGRITEPPDDVSLSTFYPLNFKEALIEKKKFLPTCMDL